MFGHIGNAHIHVNVLPGDIAEARILREQVKKIAKEVCAMGGTVTAEHGIGKLKRELLGLMLGRDGLEEIRRIKRTIDPNEILNRGNMIRFPSI
jgi:D-lactate dehydrogenase (cytochrome)